MIYWLINSFVCLFVHLFFDIFANEGCENFLKQTKKQQLGINDVIFVFIIFRREVALPGRLTCQMCSLDLGIRALSTLYEATTN